MHFPILGMRYTLGLDEIHSGILLISPFPTTTNHALVLQKMSF